MKTLRKNPNALAKKHGLVRSSVCKADRMTHLLVLTRSAHPGLLIAGRAQHLQVVALIEGARPHSLGHGEELLHKLETMNHMKAARCLVEDTGAKKRVEVRQLAFMSAAAPEASSLICLRDIAPAPESGWRGGFNKAPLDLEQKMISLLQRELIENDLYLEQGPDGIINLHTLRPRREDDVICPLRCLAFDSLTKLEGFLSQGGNKLLADKLVKVAGCAVSDEEGKAPVYTVLVGVGRYLRHFLGQRKGPNCTIKVNNAVGVSDGFLSLQTRTRNSAGIASKSVLVIKFGPDYDLSIKPDLDEPDVKRFKGALDQYFARLKNSPQFGVDRGGLSPGGDRGGLSPGGDCGGLSPNASGSGLPSSSRAGKVEDGAKVESTNAEINNAESSNAVENGKVERTKADNDEVENGKVRAESGASGAKTSVIEPVDGPKSLAPDSTKAKVTTAMPISAKADITLATLDAPINGARLVLSANGRDLLVYPAAGCKGNKKIPPHTILWGTRQGAVVNAPAGFEWKFEGSAAKKMMVVTQAETMTLGEFLKSRKGKSVGRHTPAEFAQGTCPALQCSNPWRFVAEDTNHAATIRISSGLATVTVVWQVKLKEESAQVPCNQNHPLPCCFFVTDTVFLGVKAP